MVYEFNEEYYKLKILELENELLRKSKLNKILEEKTLTGQWEWHKSYDKIIWSEQVFKCFDLDINCPAPTFEEYLDLIHGDDVEEVKHTIFNYKNTGFQFKHKYKLKNNPKKILEGFGSVDEDENGNIIMYGIIRDISEYQWLNDLIEKNKYFTAYRADPKNNIIDFCSGNIEEMLGYTKEEVIGSSSFKSVVEREEMMKIVKDKTIQKINNFDIEYRRFKKDGSI